MSFTAPNAPLGLLGIDTANPVTKAYEYSFPFDLQGRQEYIYPDGARGTLDEQSETAIKGLFRVEGAIKIKPVHDFLSQIGLKWILGGTPTGTAPVTYPESNTLIGAYVTIDRITKVDTYGLVWVNSMSITSEEGKEMEMDLDLLGQTETEGLAGSFPAGLVPAYQPPFVHSSAGSSFTINGAARQVKRVSIAMNNNLLRDRFFNSTTLQLSAKTKRTWAITVSVPANVDNYDLYNSQLPPTTDATGIFAWSDGTNTLTGTAGTLQLAGPVTKRLEAKTGELMYDVPLVARRLATTDAMTFTL